MSTVGNTRPQLDAAQSLRCLPKRLAKPVKRYCQLASKPYLTPDEEQAFERLLKWAESEPELDFWFNEADHFLAHELKLTNPSSICEVENQQIKLQRVLKSALANLSDPHSIKQDIELNREDEELEGFEIHDNDTDSIITLLAYSRFICQQAQSQLRLHGYDPGPQDGILSTKTQCALKEFQTAKCLIPNGKIDNITQEALGIRR